MMVPDAHGVVNGCREASRSSGKRVPWAARGFPTHRCHGSMHLLMQPIQCSVSVTLLVALGLVVGLRDATGQPAPLADAAKRHDWAAVRVLLDEGADVNLPLGDGATALHWASYWDHSEMTTRLLQAGAVVDATNDLGVTALWLAANNASREMTQSLLVAGADPGIALPSGETPLMTAARTGDPDVVSLLLTYGAAVDLRERSHGQTALMWAVSQEHPAVVGLLLKHGARVDERSDVYPQVVSSSGNADRSGVFEVEQGGYTPLLFAARTGGVESARLLLAAGADVNESAAMGTSPLVVAAHSGHRAVAEVLLRAGADPTRVEGGYTALHAAVLRGDEVLVKALLAHGADPDQTMTRGTPARRVSADWRLPHSMIGATPFWIAARFREPQIMEILADHGADPQTALRGETSVVAAIRGGTTRGRFGIRLADAADERRRTIQAVSLALDVGADVEACTESGDTALHAAATRRLDDVIGLLAERGATLDVRNEAGQTPLGLALTGPQGLGARYSSGDTSSTTAELLRELGAVDTGLP